jgi:uncharacterized protein DUF6272
MLNIANLKNQFNSNGVILAYNGHLSHGILTNIIEALEKKFGSMKMLNVPAQTIFTVLIEITQNIINYYAERNGKDEKLVESEGIIVLGFDKQKGKIFINSGNFVQVEDVPRISKRIDSVANLDKDTLRARFRELRKSGKNRSARGAGLGFLEIQRKASEPIKYSIEEMENGDLLFSMGVYL